MLRIKFFIESGEVLDETFIADGELVMQKEVIAPEGEVCSLFLQEANVTAKRLEAMNDPEHYLMPGRDGRNG